MIQLFEYEIPFRTPFKTGATVYNNRRGILIRYQNNNMDIAAEAAPLPGYSRESLTQVKECLQSNKRNIENFLEQDLNFQQIRELDKNEDLNLASVQFALSFLALSVLATQKGKTVYDLFRKSPSASLKVNGVVGDGEIQTMEMNILNSIQKGFDTIKIKAVHPVHELAGLLTTIQNRYPTVSFRLDANQSWPLSELGKNCGLFNKLRIQYIEEPTKIQSLDEIQKIREICPVPVALDESVQSIRALKTALKTYPGITVVLKPMILGNILTIHETTTQIRSSSTYIVFTTSLESMVGRSMVASAATLMGDPDMAHGLNTGHLFADDVLPDFKIKNGLIKNHQNHFAVTPFQHIETKHLKKLEEPT